MHVQQAPLSQCSETCTIHSALQIFNTWTALSATWALAGATLCPRNYFLIETSPASTKDVAF